VTTHVEEWAVVPDGAVTGVVVRLPARGDHCQDVLSQQELPIGVRAMIGHMLPAPNERAHPFAIEAEMP